MPTKDWIAIYDGCTIRVTNAWTGGAKLYIDGNCLDTNSALFASPKKPTLSARALGKSGEILVEIYMKSLVTVKAKICVNGAQIGGRPGTSSRLLPSRRNVSMGKRSKDLSGWARTLSNASVMESWFRNPRRTQTFTNFSK